MPVRHIYYMNMSENKILKNKLICTVTGISVRCAPKVFDQRAAKYGSNENLVNNYISALGRKLLCQGKTVEDIRKEYNVNNVPLPSADVVAKYTRWAKYRKPKTAVNNEKETQQ
jgi:hypothetical protein